VSTKKAFAIADVDVVQEFVNAIVVNIKTINVIAIVDAVN
jgi:hypothetical protein